jgi:hypothetical protein
MATDLARAKGGRRGFPMIVCPDDSANGRVQIQRSIVHVASRASGFWRPPRTGLNGPVTRMWLSIDGIPNQELAMRQVILTAAAIIACGAAVAAPTVAGHGAASPPVVQKSKVIYGQNGTDSGIAIVSQNFESSFDIYDAMAADDFKVKKATVVEVDVVGVYFNGLGPATSANVGFYKNKKGLPGKVLQEYSNAPVKDNGSGSFAIAVPKTVVKGTTWVSVQANLDFASGGEWGWESQTGVVGNPAAWQNPGDGFATGCTSWKAETSCIADGQGDHMFTILGKGK